LPTDAQTPEDARADITLIERIVARDEHAVADLYDRHNRLLYGLILRILRDLGCVGAFRHRPHRPASRSNQPATIDGCRIPCRAFA
jgi:hypothetical protein